MTNEGLSMKSSDIVGVIYDELSVSRGRRARYETYSDLELVHEYKQEKSAGGLGWHEPLKSLLTRMDRNINSLAWMMTSKAPNCGLDFDDHMQHAFLGLLAALDRFDEVKADLSGATFATYACRTIRPFLMSMIDLSSAIRCPRKKVKWRTYFLGGYVGVKKQDFEQEHGLFSQELIDAARDKYQLLISTFTSMDDQSWGSGDLDVPHRFTASEIMFDDTCPSEDQMVDRVTIQQALLKLSARQSLVMSRWSQQSETVEEIAKSLGLTVGEVRTDIRSIRAILKKAMDE